MISLEKLKKSPWSQRRSSNGFRFACERTLLPCLYLYRCSGTSGKSNGSKARSHPRTFLPCLLLYRCSGTSGKFKWFLGAVFVHPSFPSTAWAAEKNMTSREPIPTLHVGSQGCGHRCCQRRKEQRAGSHNFRGAKGIDVSRPAANFAKRIARVCHKIQPQWEETCSPRAAAHMV